MIETLPRALTLCYTPFNESNSVILIKLVVEVVRV
jgi:hypothetical protein